MIILFIYIYYPFKKRKKRKQIANHDLKSLNNKKKKREQYPQNSRKFIKVFGSNSVLKKKNTYLKEF